MENSNKWILCSLLLTYSTCVEGFYGHQPLPQFDLYLKGTAGESIGAPSSYLTLGAFAPLSYLSCNDTFTFLDLRLHYFQRDSWAGNAGLGARYPVADYGWLGFNAFYDFRKGCHHFQQVGVGVEFLGCQYNLRANGYFPIGDRSEFFCCEWEELECGCLLLTEEFRKTLTGFDVEIERYIPLSSCFYTPIDLYGAIGGYYYYSPCRKDVAGPRVRLDGYIGDYLNFGGVFTYDPVYHCKFQVYLSFNLLFGLPNPSRGCCGNSCCNDSIYNPPVWREEFIVRSKHCHQCSVIPYSPFESESFDCFCSEGNCN